MPNPPTARRRADPDAVGVDVQVFDVLDVDGRDDAAEFLADPTNEVVGDAMFPFMHIGHGDVAGYTEILRVVTARKRRAPDYRRPIC